MQTFYAQEDSDHNVLRKFKLDEVAKAESLFKTTNWWLHLKTSQKLRQGNWFESLYSEREINYIHVPMWKLGGTKIEIMV